MEVDPHGKTHVRQFHAATARRNCFATGFLAVLLMQLFRSAVKSSSGFWPFFVFHKEVMYMSEQQGLPRQRTRRELYRFTYIQKEINNENN